MGGQQRWTMTMAACAAALALAGCGGDANNDSASPPDSQPTPAPPVEAGQPAITNNVAVDGRNWINYRRGQAGVPTVTQNGQLDTAAQGHSDWQRRNNKVSHEQTAGTTGFTGITVRDRLTAAGYTFSGSFAYGEVIAATTNRNGGEMVDELITAIFHRFVIFEPVFKEVGTGAATGGNTTGATAGALAGRASSPICCC